MTSRLYGFLTGLLLSLALAGMALGWVVTQGITVPVPVAPLARTVGQEVTREGRVLAPRVIAQIQGRAPGEVLAELNRHMLSMQVNIGGFEVPVPPNMARAITISLRQRLVIAVKNYLGSLKPHQLAVMMGQTAQKVAMQTLPPLLRQLPVRVPLVPGLAWPEVDVHLLPE